MVRKAYLTPPDIPEGVSCRTLKMPDSKEWLGVFNSALLTLMQNWQWEQVNPGDLTVDEAVAKVYEILTEFWAVSECEGCFQPTGEPFIGYNELGEFEQLYADGWGEPSGDYAVPPIPPRTTGTSVDKRCLAAANATNVLKILYEQLSDDYAESLGTAEALSNLIALIVLVIGSWLGLAVAAVILIYRIMFQVVYETIEFVTSDYWTSDFDDLLQCALFACAEVDGAGVVTFNMECVVKEIAKSTNVITNPFFVLLFGQVQAMLNIIGTDGLNAAGGTTAITSAECICWFCILYDYAADNGGFAAVNPIGAFTPPFLGAYSSGAWRQTTTITNASTQHTTGAYIYKTWAASATVTKITIVYDKTNGTFNAGAARRMQVIGQLAGVNVFDTGLVGAETNGTDKVFTWTGTAIIDKIFVRDDSRYTTTSAGTAGVVTIKSVQVEGVGTNPDEPYACYE